MFKSILHSITALVVTLSVATMAYAQVSQTPLLTRATAVVPNLVFVFDDSGSMVNQFIYQFGGDETGHGRLGPANTRGSAATCPSALNFTTTCAYNAPAATNYFELSPDVNRMHYDPRVRYQLRINSSGTTAAPSTPDNTTFSVYFYSNGAGGSVAWPGPVTGNDATLLASYLINLTTTTAQLAIGATPGLVYPQSVATGTGPFPKFLDRTDCNAGLDGGSCSLAEERQNYANWRKYHSNRIDLVKTGLSYGFQNLPLSALRLGWGTIGKLGVDSPQLDSGVSLYNQARKDGLYTWLFAHGTPSGTPNRRAIDAVGKYYERKDAFGPWATTPRADSTGVSTLSRSDTVSTDTDANRRTHVACRRSFSLLVTDGFYTDSNSDIGVGEVDADSSTINITGLSRTGTALSYTYNGTQRPYAKAQQNTFADVTMRYWGRDLRTDVDNRVPEIPATVVNGVTVNRGNESFWQNMSFYAVGLGVFGTLPQTSTTLANLTTPIAQGGINWPDAVGSKETTIDDMWHATINARGRQLSAKNTTDLSQGIASMLSDISKQISSQSGVAISTANLTVGTRKFTPRYQSGSWTGNVVARNLNPNTGSEISTAWQVVGQSTTSGTTVTYSGIPNHSERNIVTWSGSAQIPFANTSDVTNSMTSAVTANMINYLRGDQSNEGESGTRQYRPREALLGDIVNSTPAFIKSGVDLKYQSLPVAGSATYRQFVTETKAARTEGVVFVGANDGMLHAFREGTGAGDTPVDGGKEIFAYIPRAVLPNLHLLASKSYDHRYYVDGPNIETDVYTEGSWKNLLVGTTGAGAKAIFALNVTNPLSPSVLWESSASTNSAFAQMGHVLSDVATGYTPSGHWVGIFGNGYDSAAGTARLFIVNLENGSFLKEIVVGAAGGNGLGAVRVVRDASQRIIGAYAGDLRGKMWKFDLAGASISDWQAGLNGQPLFDTALSGAAQAITATPVVIPHPTTAGNVISFATGKLFEASDLDTTAGQSVYGVLDSIPFGSASTAMSAVALSNLVLQTIAETTSATRAVTTTDLTQVTQSVAFFSISRNTVTYSATVRGWRINLPAANTGQRTVYPLESLANRYIVLDTISPTGVSTSDACVQGGQGKGWLYFIDGLTGSGPSEAVIDTNGDNQINASDGLSSGLTNVADGRNLVAINESGSSSSQTTYAIFGGGTGDATRARLTCTLLGNCPISTIFRSREWRQLFMR